LTLNERKNFSGNHLQETGTSLNEEDEENESHKEFKEHIIELARVDAFISWLSDIHLSP